MPVDWPVYRDFVAYWWQYEAFKFGEVWDPTTILSLYVLLPSFLYGVPTVLMGISFGILQRAVHDDLRTSGLKVGVLQAGNIVGNVAGSLLAGLLLLGTVIYGVAASQMITPKRIDKNFAWIRGAGAEFLDSIEAENSAA